MGKLQLINESTVPFILSWSFNASQNRVPHWAINPLQEVTEEGNNGLYLKEIK